MADAAADEGATNSQGRLQIFAGLYSWRHTSFRRIMAKIQTFLVKLKKEEKEMKKEKEKNEDPFGSKEAQKLCIPTALTYGEEGKPA